MPFTPTHVAAIIPVAFLGRRWFPFSALAIGAMVPDLPLYLPGALDYQVTHSPAGLVAICLPVGILCFLCFHPLGHFYSYLIKIEDIDYCTNSPVSSVGKHKPCKREIGDSNPMLACHLSEYISIRPKMVNVRS